ncbi:helix-turn-helix domain-containing protein [Kineosporia sp. J2-2]|uniref:Helix-turn-helix domain-containing protein n=1 Tax=Kineosporia corallincola TaxID=2835133 RepID=A0ABS5TC43_9ACTN|nr:helix-turn-helix transcriptional regulator [Kineosporia corallincola]MBT0768650.1 helix-turn-helix domain-containing protein [Kineosporia corallincola]
MHPRETAAAFLRARRDRVTPEAAGLPGGGDRRVPGLRRTEVAMIAGVSVEYYTRLERGNLRGVSPGVLDALGRALRLDPVEREYLHDLARLATVPARPATPVAPPGPVPPALLQIIEGMPHLPAYVANHRMDVLACNSLGRALYAPLWSTAGNEGNLARFGFLDPAARSFYPDWAEMARFAAGFLRRETARDPGDQQLAALVAELSARSQDFRQAWAAQEVTALRAAKRIHHPLVGDIALQMDTLQAIGNDGLSVVVYTPIAGAGGAEALALLEMQAPAPQHPAEVRR